MLLTPIHPGEILLEDFIKPLGLSGECLAHLIGVPENQVAEICQGRAGINQEMAGKLAAYFGTSVEIWTGLQESYDQRLAERSARDGH